VPLTPFQLSVAGLLAPNRSDDSHLAGGAALLLEPNSSRYSNDLDYFHDSVSRVASAYQADSNTLLSAGMTVSVVLAQPGFVRAMVALGALHTKVEWAHDSAWRFMPVRFDPRVGTLLHPVDLATNKVLALVGRREPRDLLDALYLHDTVLPFGATVWAAAGKDPGFTPHAILDLARRVGRYRQRDLDRLDLAKPMDITVLKQRWLVILDSCEAFINGRPPDEIGCLYWDGGEFVQPAPGSKAVCHYGRPGGVIPVVG